MGIVVALDLHRKQITYKALDRETGEVRRGRIAPAARVDVRACWRSSRRRPAIRCRPVRGRDQCRFHAVAMRVLRRRSRY